MPNLADGELLDGLGERGVGLTAAEEGQKVLTKRFVVGHGLRMR